MADYDAQCHEDSCTSRSRHPCTAFHRITKRRINGSTPDHTCVQKRTACLAWDLLLCSLLAAVSRPLLATSFSLCNLRLFVIKRIYSLSLLSASRVTLVSPAEVLRRCSTRSYPGRSGFIPPPRGHSSTFLVSPILPPLSSYLRPALGSPSTIRPPARRRVAAPRFRSTAFGHDAHPRSEQPRFQCTCPNRGHSTLAQPTDAAKGH